MVLRKQGWIILLLVFSLAGCDALGQLGGTALPATPTSQSQGTPGAESTPPPVLPSETEPAPQLPGIITLHVWVPPEFDPNAATPAGDLLKARLEAFTAQNPGVSIDVRLKAVDGAGGLLESLVTASSAAPLALPDLVALPRPLLESAALKGLIYPYDLLNLSLDSQGWFEYARQMGYLQTTLFGLPFAGDALVLAHRPDVLSAPHDWQALLSSNQVLVFPAADPKAYVTLALYLGQGGTLQDEQGRPVLTESALLSVMEYYYQAAAMNLMPFWLTQLETDDQAWAAFTADQHPMLITWLSHYLAEQRTASVNLELTFLPTADATHFTLATGWSWALASTDPVRRELSTRLAEFLVDEAFLATWTQAAGYLPPRPGALAQWTDSTSRDVLEQIARSAQLVPPTELLVNLGPLLEQAAVDVLKAESTPIFVVQTALEQLNSP
jgi:multiple sugar transport system substrate-binding protein